MRVKAALISQLERCGLSASLAATHDETSESAERSRLIRTEVARAWAVQDQGSLPEAEAALAWLRAEPHTEVAVGTPVDLVDPDTGEVLVSGRPGAVLWTPNMVVKWCCGDPMGIGEPEDDLGLIAMGLELFAGSPFKTCYVAFDGLQAFPRRSPVFEPDSHAGLFARIKAAVGRPPVACPGDWCSACRQRFYCPAWKARTELALTVLPAEVQALEITDQNAPALWLRIKAVEQACELAKEQVKSFVRAGGRLAIDGKQYYLAQCEGRETADVKAIKAAGLTQYLKQGAPYETTRWKSIEGAAAPRKTKAPAARLVGGKP